MADLSLGEAVYRRVRAAADRGEDTMEVTLEERAALLEWLEGFRLFPPRVEGDGDQGHFLVKGVRVRARDVTCGPAPDIMRGYPPKW